MICAQCSDSFEQSAKSHFKKVRKFCSKKCGSAYQNKMAGRNSSYLLLPSGTVGTISELEVALDLLKKGYEVYRPVTPNCSGDFMIEKNFEWNKIEVKTGYQHLKNKTIIFSKKNIRTKLLAIVIPRLKEIRYFSFPSMEAIEI